MNPHTFCNYLYNLLSIPLYLYEEKKLTGFFPSQSNDTFPLFRYLSDLWNRQNGITYISTSFHSYYGCVKIKNSECCIVIGPVNSLPYSNEILFQLRREFDVAQENTADFNRFFSRIPTMSMEKFFHTLLLINYEVNDTTLDISDLRDSSPNGIVPNVTKEYFSNSYVLNDSLQPNNNAELEKKMLLCIENGDMEGIQNFLAHTHNSNIGIMADDNLRQTKNTFIVTISLATRAAIRGGLATSFAYKLSDTYIQQVERLTDVKAVTHLIYQALLEFTQRTSIGTPLNNAPKDMYQVINYIHDHLNEKLTVDILAQKLGFNRSYLSRKFKKELGFDLSVFIIRCKLETGKYLLAYSNKSISEISIRLCFSSQSHFQNAFKKNFHTTPLQYRNQTKK